MQREVTIDSKGDGLRLDRWFRERYPGFAFGQIQKMMRKGEIRLNGKRVKGNERLKGGDQVRVPPAAQHHKDAPNGPRKPKALRLTDDQIKEVRGWILWQNADAIVLNKPAGLATQGGSGQGSRHLDALLDALERIDDERPKLVHRLDKDTSGVLLVARTRAAAAHFTKAFRARTTDKRYWALVMGVPKTPEGQIKLKMDKVPIQGNERMVVTEDGKTSLSDYAVIDRAAQRAAFLSLRPLTGRTHQLRLHCATIGHPIVGDGKYGGAEAFLTGSISRKLHLHSRHLRVDLPSGGRLDVTAPLPDHMKASFEALGFETRRVEDPLDDEENSW